MQNLMNSSDFGSIVTTGTFSNFVGTTTFSNCFHLLSVEAAAATGLAEADEYMFRLVPRHSAL
jgi:hypothetical protein